jgi:hypothetical protein
MTESATAGRGTVTDALSRDSTLRGVRTSEKGRLARRARWGAIVALIIVVGVAASGWLGVRTETVSASGDGFRLTVGYATVARAGLDVPLRVQVDRLDGSDFDDDVTLEINARYLSIFETQGFQPDPDQSAAVGDAIRMTFTQPPTGPSFVLNYDAYIQPASQIGTDGQVGIVVDDAPVVTVEFHTTLLP